MNVHTKPSARQIQPMGFMGRLEAIRAPTRGKARKGTKNNSSPRASLVTLLLGTSCAEWARTFSAPLATNMARERPASDHASQKAARALILLVPRSRLRSPASAVTTTLFYAAIVSYSLRKALRGRRLRANFGDGVFSYELR